MYKCVFIVYRGLRGKDEKLPNSWIPSALVQLQVAVNGPFVA